MTPTKYDGFYSHFGLDSRRLRCRSWDWVLSYPIYGTPRELFERWRERDLRIPLEHMFKLNLRDEQGLETYYRTELEGQFDA